jgi:hypothetical protein
LLPGEGRDAMFPSRLLMYLLRVAAGGGGVVPARHLHPTAYFMGQMTMNQKVSRCKLEWVGRAVVGAMLALAATPAGYAATSKEQQLVDKAQMTWESFAASPALSSELRDWLRVAKGVFIVPQIIRVAARTGGWRNRA